MPLRWVLFDLNGTLVDPCVLGGPLGGSPEDEAHRDRVLPESVPAPDVDGRDLAEVADALAALHAADAR